MYTAMGVYMRNLIADKIEDRVLVPKAPLKPSYAERKQRKYGRTKPILVASSRLAKNVRNAKIKIKFKGFSRRGR
jgi:hypothetical protein